VSRPWRSFDQPREVATGLLVGSALEHPAGRQHQGDPRTGELLADRQRACQGEDGDEIDAEAPMASGVDDPPRRRRQTGGRRDPPDGGRGAGLPDRPTPDPDEE
jgi:hypothetical protein